MKKRKLYVLLERDGLVRDIITFPHEDYLEIELDYPIPDDVMSGYYMVIDNELVVDEERKTKVIESRIPYDYEPLKKSITELDKENRFLKLQNKTLGDHADFQDSVLLEIIQKIYE
ncbi:MULTISPECIES: hypothetical protein [Paenibacillus]|uniref:Uncharacterized protein n=1 Tax=Paenibacillus pabuli TaxID=1472 RepID=A0A855XR90_9BACL|nr:MULTISPECIES: hypothetical protein [Paenibacillus]PWW37406.1 hypothetical protein DET56_109293 [Paenibacillus pabuli]PXW05548.1 hypothetical protein DEU73_108292 [Paenibacillus taichungensis]